MSNFKNRVSKIFTKYQGDIINIDSGAIVKYLDEYLKVIHYYLANNLDIPDHTLWDIVMDMRNVTVVNNRYVSDIMPNLPIDKKLEIILDNNNHDYMEWIWDNNIEKLYLLYPDYDVEVFLKLLNIIYNTTESWTSHSFDIMDLDKFLLDDGGMASHDILKYLNNKDNIDNKLRLLNYIDNVFSPQWNNVLKYIGMDAKPYVSLSDNYDIIYIVNVGVETKIYNAKEIPPVTVYDRTKEEVYSKEDIIKIINFYRELVKHNICNISIYK